MQHEGRWVARTACLEMDNYSPTIVLADNSADNSKMIATASFEVVGGKELGTKKAGAKRIAIYNYLLSLVDAMPFTKTTDHSESHSRLGLLEILTQKNQDEFNPPKNEVESPSLLTQIIEGVHQKCEWWPGTNDQARLDTNKLHWWSKYSTAKDDGALNKEPLAAKNPLQINFTIKPWLDTAKPPQPPQHEQTSSALVQSIGVNTVRPPATLEIVDSPSTIRIETPELILPKIVPSSHSLSKAIQTIIKKPKPVMTIDSGPKTTDVPKGLLWGSNDGCTTKEISQANVHQPPAKNNNGYPRANRHMVQPLGKSLVAASTATGPSVYELFVSQAQFIEAEEVALSNKGNRLEGSTDGRLNLHKGPRVNSRFENIKKPILEKKRSTAPVAPGKDHETIKKPTAHSVLKVRETIFEAARLSAKPNYFVRKKHHVINKNVVKKTEKDLERTLFSSFLVQEVNKRQRPLKTALRACRQKRLPNRLRSCVYRPKHFNVYHHSINRKNFNFQENRTNQLKPHWPPTKEQSNAGIEKKYTPAKAGEILNKTPDLLHNALNGSVPSLATYLHTINQSYTRAFRLTNYSLSSHQTKIAKRRQFEQTRRKLMVISCSGGSAVALLTIWLVL